MYEDRVEISSPGGLPAGLSKDEYLYGNISVLRNPIIAGVFYRLNIIERFGTGKARIKHEYANSRSKPGFDISEHRITIVLPVVDDKKPDLSRDERLIYDLLKEEEELSRAEIDMKSGFEKTKTIRILNNLIYKNIVVKEGRGTAVIYKLR